MNQTLRPLHWDVYLAYLDDIIVYSPSFNQYLLDVSHISTLLKQFTRKGFPFIWTKPERLSFDQLKAAVTSPTALILPDPSRPYTIRTDPSHVGKYADIELEALAIWWNVIQKLRSYIEGQQFFPGTVDKPLLSLMKKPYYNARIERWMTILQQYGMIIRHIPGKENTTFDALSSYSIDKPDVNDEDASGIVTSSKQTEDLLVNIVTTHSMPRL
ncbi:unnamed protein product [Rotaria sp. Silwood1]|nr:unnamed protein product [Rotaria sp. Silwood1]CAF1627824.1 unnamed protein product [Rotaria sp. Silwood1]CAF3750796.1 unnamed protein product [Rotaria sp. Silwood1]CAF3789587.1 unnamed protein product [Rotaria sp. Silwood1]CAF3814599.1 unnamed protein product [Rotaria sp. Silwood1]